MSMAVITGASAGMGREFVRAVRVQRPEIDEFLLIARRRERLEAIAAELPGVRVNILALDLTDSASFNQIAAFFDAHRPKISLLINNAGFGTLGETVDSSLTSQTNMVALNCGALTAMCVLAAPYFQRGGAIINVSSIASYVPTPRMTVYSATKSYVTGFSRALRSEMKADGINVMALCPGPMDTEFLDVAGITGRSRMFDRLPRVSPEKAAQLALRQAYRGRAVCTPTFVYKLYRVLAKLLPHAWLIDSATC